MLSDVTIRYAWHTGKEYSEVDAMALGRTPQGIKGWALSYPAMKAKRLAQELMMESAGAAGAAGASGGGDAAVAAPAFEYAPYDAAARDGDYELAFSLALVAAAEGDPNAAFTLGR